MFQEPQSFSQKIEISGKLMQMLNEPALTPEQLFAVPNIQGDIITNMQNLTYFLSYCKQRKEFTKALFKICFDSSYEDFENDDKKNVAQYMMKIFTHDQMTLNNFMFGQPETNKETAQKQEDQQILEKQESQKKQQLNIQPKQQVAQKYQLVTLSLQHLQRDNKNETCLGYINQLYASILNKAGNLFIQFLEQHPKYTQLLIGNMQYTSIGKMIANILSFPDKKQQYRCQKFKKYLFQRVCQYGFTNIENSEKFQGFIEAIQSILNFIQIPQTMYMLDFTRCANTLVSQQTLGRFYRFLYQSQLAFENAAKFLQIIMKKINSLTVQKQINYYNPQGTSVSSLHFQHIFFYQEFENLVALLEKVSNYQSKMGKLSYLGFLKLLLNNLFQNQHKLIKSLKIFQKLIDNYQSTKSQGLLKNYAYQLLMIILQHICNHQTQDIAKWLLEAQIDLSDIRKLLNDFTKQNSNDNATSCYTISLFSKIKQKVNGFIDAYQQQNNVNILQRLQKYQQKLGADEQDSSEEELRQKFKKAFGCHKDNDEQQQSNTNVNAQQVKQKKEEKQKRTDLIYPQQYEYDYYAQTYPIQENYQYATQQKQQEKPQGVQDNNQGQTQIEGQDNVANQVQIQSESAGSLNDNEAEQGTSHKVNDHK